MKKIILFIHFLLIFSLSFSAPVSESKAKEIAQKYYKYVVGNSKSYSINTINEYFYNKTITMYIVNFNDGGFVIVASDDNIDPILAYSETNTAPAAVTNSEVKWWLDTYSKQIEYVILNTIENKSAQLKWLAIETEKFSAPTKDVLPLLTTTWDQMGAYNDFCPGNTPVGCVATAMAQVMNYWEYPVTGVSIHSYTDPTYGLLN
jgi:endo-1,4-beta-mannosidase